VTFRGQHYREVSGDTKQAALKRLLELEARLEKKGTVAEKKVPFDFLCDEYLRWTEINLAPQTRRERVIAIRAHLKPFFRGLVRDIDVRGIEAYKAARMATGIFTGSRIGDVQQLEWSDVDLGNRLLHGSPKETWGPKTDNSARTIPLCDTASGHLRHHEGHGPHRHQDDDDLRIDGEEPHSGTGREAQRDFRPHLGLSGADSFIICHRHRIPFSSLLSTKGQT